MERIRIGIVGTGFGALAHLPALQHHPRFDVVALASPSSAAGIARERNVPHSFHSCKEMLEGVALDAVTIASPPFTHHPDVLSALAARKHVLCEKPFALDVAQAQAMCAAAAQAGTACGVSHEFRFIPQVQAVYELVRNGHLGAPRDVEITLLRSTLRREERRPRGWWFDRERGGGLAGALLSHLIDQANWLFGKAPERFVGFSRTANPQREDQTGTFTSSVDDGAAALLQYSDAVLARLCADATTAVESYTLAVHGEQRTAVASGATITQIALYTVDHDATDELACTPSPYAAFEWLGSNVPPLMELYDQFARAVAGEPNQLPTFADALATQRVLESVGYGV